MGLWDKRLVDQVSDVPGLIFAKFFAKTLSIYFYKITKMKINSFECPKSMRNYEVKLFGASDAWSTSHLSHRANKPAYFRLSDFYAYLLFGSFLSIPKK